MRIVTHQRERCHSQKLAEAQSEIQNMRRRSRIHETSEDPLGTVS